ncbi:MAG: D-alanyl-D-alanine carboxypeptidase [Cytophagales bacterium]|nr:D-alanyl-D-alanine carboxypeptidase [Cytophagales bacterium]
MLVNSEKKYLSVFLWLFLYASNPVAGQCLFEEDSLLSNTLYGFAVKEAGDSDLLVDCRSHYLFTPASNTKLLTLYASLFLLEKEMEGIRYRTANDTLYFTGTANPALLHPDFPKCVSLAFLQKCALPLVYVPSIHKIAPLGPGWAWDDYYDRISTECSTFPLYGNFVRVRFLEEENTISPALFCDSLAQSAETLPYAVTRALHSNLFYRAKSCRYERDSADLPFRTSDALTALLLQDTLQKPVLARGKDINWFQSTKEAVRDTLLRYMMQESDNFIAEQMLHHIHLQQFDTMDYSACLELLKDSLFYQLPDPFVWKDGSGLSRYNLNSPANLLKTYDLLEKLIGRDRLLTFLAAGGQSGTLKDQFVSEEPFVFGKSGSMSNNYILSGYLIAKSGKVLNFCFMATHFPCRVAVMKKKVEQILTRIREEW